MAGETIMSIAYGLEIQHENDPYVKMAEKGFQPLVAAAVPGAYLVDTLHFLKHVPEWVPGAGFQRKAREWKKWARKMVEVPFEAAKRNIVGTLAVSTSFPFLTLNRLLESLLLVLSQSTLKRWNL